MYKYFRMRTNVSFFCSWLGNTQPVAISVFTVIVALSLFSALGFMPSMSSAWLNKKASVNFFVDSLAWLEMQADNTRLFGLE